jgi:integrase
MARRRGHGSGAVYKRKVDGKVVGWTAMLDLGFENGRRKRQAFYGRTMDEVQAKLDEARQAQRKGTFVPGPKITTGQWLERWLRDVAKPNVRPSTFRSYSGLLRDHVLPTLGSIPLERLSPADVRQVMNAKLANGLSPRTVHHFRAVLRNALHQAERDGLVTRNAAALAEPPRVQRQEMKSLNPDQARAFQHAIKDDELEALYLIALDSGLRQGEVLGLRWEDVNLDAGTVRVSYALQRVAGKLVLVEPKSKTSRRAVKLGTVAALALREHHARQAQESGRVTWLPFGLVFTGPHGQPLDGVAVTKRFQAVLKAAGLPKMRFHDLRHSSASLLLAQGIPARVVMERLGHSNIALTLGTYSHVIPQLHQEAADAMDRVLSTS